MAMNTPPPRLQRSVERAWFATCAAIIAGVAPVFAPAPARAQNQLQAVRLKEIKNLDKLDPNWIMGMCNLPGLECNKVEKPKLYEHKTTTGTEYYAVMANRTISRLVMKAPRQWQLLNRWSFETYPLPSNKDDPDDSRMIDIHPALYPVGFGLWAVAVLNSKTEGYSGGGAEFVTADFVTLDPEVSDIGEQERRFRAVPFSCSKTVRACFTEKEYKTSPHCHDESSGYLTLKFAVTPASRFYDWTATWHQTSWPAGVLRTGQIKTQTAAALKPGKQTVAADTFPFCDRGPVGP
jgi:hypothetical protein